MAKLFSIKEKYSNKIYSKEKLVEFRRQNVNVQEGEVCLIYTSSPVKKITGYFVVKEKVRTNIKKLWELTKKIAGISYEEFKDYFKECIFGTAIIFKKIQKFSRALSLEDLRKRANFTPPQSYCNLNHLLMELFSDFVPQKRLKEF
jgi:predicted transcriptional regulator